MKNSVLRCWLEKCWLKQTDLSINQEEEEVKEEEGKRTRRRRRRIVVGVGERGADGTNNSTKKLPKST